MSTPALPEPGEIFRRELRGGTRQSWFARRPLALMRPDLALIAVHGISRNAGEQATALASCAEALGCVLLAPLFGEADCHGYQRLGWAEGENRADLMLDAMLSDLGNELGQRFQRLLLWGFSGGAQFAHRYALTQPRRVVAQALGAAGWYTWPDPASPFPFGTAQRRRRIAQGLDLDGFLAVPTLVLIGELDRSSDEAVRRNEKLDQQQGAHRLERAHRWTQAVNDAAHARGLPPPATLRQVPGVGHEFAALAAAGGAAMLTAWFQAQLDANLRPRAQAGTFNFQRRHG